MGNERETLKLNLNLPTMDQTRGRAGGVIVGGTRTRLSELVVNDAGAAPARSTGHKRKGENQVQPNPRYLSKGKYLRTFLR